MINEDPTTAPLGHPAPGPDAHTAPTAPAADEPVTYGSLTPRPAQPDDSTPSAPAFLSGMRRSSFWPDNFSF
ncbi:MAG: hypothetical protein Q4C34_03890 [Bacteroidales bacterium]|nr:hypothetical protein [Bacteroidales bacterium]